jgi:hypothetical protein
MPKLTIRRALSLKQPFAELVLLKKKKYECRPGPTNILNEPIYIYAPHKGPRTPEQLEEQTDPETMEQIRLEYKVVFDKKKPGYTYIDLEALPRGYLVGTVEIVDCKEGEDDDEFYWYLRAAKRLPKLLEPARPPFGGGFFIPFPTKKKKRKKSK